MWLVILVQFRRAYEYVISMGKFKFSRLPNLNREHSVGAGKLDLKLTLNPCSTHKSGVLPLSYETPPISPNIWCKDINNIKREKYYKTTIEGVSLITKYFSCILSNLIYFPSKYCFIIYAEIFGELYGRIAHVSSVRKRDRLKNCNVQFMGCTWVVSLPLVFSWCYWYVCFSINITYQHVTFK